MITRTPTTTVTTTISTNTVQKPTTTATTTTTPSTTTTIIISASNTNIMQIQERPTSFKVGHATTKKQFLYDFFQTVNFLGQNSSIRIKHMSRPFQNVKSISMSVLALTSHF